MSVRCVIESEIRLRYSANKLIQCTAKRLQSSFAEVPRINPVGIQHLSHSLHRQLFPGKEIDEAPSKEQTQLIELSKQYLDYHQLLGKKTNIAEPISFQLPLLQGKNLDEHFKKIALFSSKDYLGTARRFADLAAIPKKPKTWVMESGWIKYPSDGTKPHHVDYPDEEIIVFDVETLYKVSNYAVMAAAVSPTAWYAWVSPILTGESDSFDHLIPLDTLGKERVVIGHNVGYDRARILEEYNLKESKAFFLDTMSLHIAASGMCSRQRPKWMQHRKQKSDIEYTPEEIQRSEMEDPWVSYSSPNSLAEVAQFYCGMEISKDVREMFAGEDVESIKENFQVLMNYCATDVSTTYNIYIQVLPEFLRVCPHPVSFAALRFLGGGILPTNKDWQRYLDSAEGIYQESRKKVDDHLLKLAEKAVKLKDKPEIYLNDPWLKQLDWTIHQAKFKQNGQPYKNQRLPGFPKWYRDLHNAKQNKLIITSRTRITPLLLKLTWEGYPVIWSDVYGWCFRVNASDYQKMKDKNYVYEKKFRVTKPDPEEQEIIDQEEAQHQLDNFTALNSGTVVDSGVSADEEFVYFRVPNNQGPEARTALLLAKGFGSFFEKGILSSESSFAQEALNINASCSYWISSRERIMRQFVVPKTKKYSIILPQVLTMGTITRRAVEKTWLTASNAKKTRIGSELKSKIKAPPGYCLVGADVDSEELWIASLVGDSMFKMHGGTAIGWMTLEGTKGEGTDLHSKTASILGIARDEAKIFNYGRIYGAGLKFATRLLKQFNPKLTDKECAERAKSLYNSTKGKSARYFQDGDRQKLWFGGTESILFNRLENIAEQDSPKTPVLGAGITTALLKKNLKNNSFLPSRINWAIQSSGVDYLHLLCVSMNYLIKLYGIDARLCISVHDEIRYLVKEKDKYRAALALQISNLWTRALFCERLGISDVPQSCAFFSAVDIDHVLRKEVDMDCITPSNPKPIDPGESLDIIALLAKEESKLGEEKILNLGKTEALPVARNAKNFKMKDFNYSLDNIEWKKTYLEMQIAQGDKEFKTIWKQYQAYLKKLEWAEMDSFAENGALSEPIEENSKRKRVPSPSTSTSLSKRKNTKKTSKFNPTAIDSYFQQSEPAKPQDDLKYKRSTVSSSSRSPSYNYKVSNSYAAPNSFTPIPRQQNIAKTSVRSYKTNHYKDYLK